MVPDDPTSPERTRHLTHIHRAHGHQDADAAAADKSAHMEHCQCRCPSLESAADDTEKRTKLDVAFPAIGVASPHHEKRADRSASAKEAIGGGDC